MNVLSACLCLKAKKKKRSLRGGKKKERKERGATQREVHDMRRADTPTHSSTDGRLPVSCYWQQLAPSSLSFLPVRWQRKTFVSPVVSERPFAANVCCRTLRETEKEKKNYKVGLGEGGLQVTPIQNVETTSSFTGLLPLLVHVPSGSPSLVLMMWTGVLTCCTLPL